MPLGLEDGVSLCFGLRCRLPEPKPLVVIEKLTQSRLEKRGLCEEATGLLQKTRPGGSTQEEPGLGKSWLKLLLCAVNPFNKGIHSASICWEPTFCRILCLILKYILNYNEE